MKFRLKIGHLYGPLAPDSNGGRTYGMYMVPWIKSVKESLGTGLKETKGLADTLRDSVELSGGARTFNGSFESATVEVDAAEFPFLIRHAHMPEGFSEYIELVERDDKPGLACTVGSHYTNSVDVIKDAMRRLIEINAWAEVRRLAEVLMDIEDEQPV